MFAHLVDPDVGLCARRARFGEAHVVEAVASMGGGRFDADTVLRPGATFLASDHVVRLVEPSGRERTAEAGEMDDDRPSRARAPRARRLDTLAAARVAGVPADVVDAAITAEGRLGADQADAVRALNAPVRHCAPWSPPPATARPPRCTPPPWRRSTAGRRVLGLATTNQAAAELRDVGIRP